MSKGILGTWNLVSGVNQAVYVNNYSDIATVTVSVCIGGLFNLSSQVHFALRRYIIVEALDFLPNAPPLRNDDSSSGHKPCHIPPGPKLPTAR